jgi:hypothetical protein
MKSDNFTSWRKSTYSHGTGNCVEVRTNRRFVGVRDTAQPEDGPVLQFHTAAWLAFIGNAKAEAVSYFS